MSMTKIKGARLNYKYKIKVSLRYARITDKPPKRIGPNFYRMVVRGA